MFPRNFGMWNCPKVFLCEKSISCCVRRTLYKIFNQSARFSIYNLKRMSVKVSLTDAMKVNSNDSNRETLKSRPKKNKLPPSNAVLSHLKLCTETCNIESIPTRVLRKVKSLPEGLYIVGDRTARIIAENLMSNNFAENDVPLVEVNPGICLLTKCLLEREVLKINVLQSMYWSRIHEISKQYPGRICMYEYDFFKLCKYMLLEIPESEERMKAIIPAIESKKWTDGPAMKIVAAIPNRLFLNQVIVSTIFQKGLMLNGRAELYLILRPYDFLRITCGKEAGYNMYRSTSVLFQNLFETSLLEKLPRKDFLPWEQSSPKSQAAADEFHTIDEDYLYLIKVVPRQDLFELVGGSENLKPFWYFVCQSFTSRKNRVIPTLEKWIPGCGPYLILRGMTIFTQFGELSPSEMIGLFHQFTQWPEYSKSTFLPSMQSNFLGTYTDINKDDVNDPEMESAEENVDFKSQPVSK